jgi:glycerol kinase
VIEKYCVTIDQGTTGTRCVILDHDNNMIAWKYLEHEQKYPKPSWVEHDPKEIRDNVNQVIQLSLKEAKIKTEEIAAIGVTNQRETTVVWDRKTGEPYYNAVVWQCTRTRPFCEELRAQNYERDLIYPHTGIYAFTYFSGPKIKWILDNVPEVREKAEKGEAVFGTIDTWCIWWLTGGPKGGAHVTDYTNASRTMLMNLKTLDWDPEICELLKIPMEMLPRIVPSSDKDIYGYTSKESPFRAEIPVCGDLGDQQGALVGQMCFRAGEAKNTYGTGSFVLYNTGDKIVFSKHGLLTTCAYSTEKGKCIYALEGSIANTGAVIQWLRDNLKIIKSASETEEIAKAFSDTGANGIFFVPAFSGLFAPYWDSDARGIIVGLTRSTRKEHIVHAALESICWQTRSVYDAVTADIGVRLESLKVDGGASVNNYLMQLQADTIGAKVIRPAITETTALGAAYMAGLAVGFWENLDEIIKLWKVDRIFEPKWSEEKREKLYKGWKVAVEKAKGWLRETGELPPSGTTVE